MLPFAQLPEPLPALQANPFQQGEQLVIGGQPLRSPWRWIGSDREQPQQLWLPLDLLEARLGFRRRDGQLEWFGLQQPLAAFEQRTIGDEVGLEVSGWLAQIGVSSRLTGTQLVLNLPPAGLTRLRRGKGSTANRVVLDLDGPLFVQRIGDDLLVNLRSTPAQQRELQRLKLTPQQSSAGLLLKGQATRLQTLSLAAPWRLVLDGVRRSPTAAAVDPLNLAGPAVAGWIRRGLLLEQRTLTVGVKPLQVLRSGGDLPRIGLALKPLAMAGQQQGLRFLPQLSQPAGAVVAVNGGFFNRILQLPLGALRQDGRWLSGPILNRGVIAWDGEEALRFGRLRLDQELQINGGRRWGLGFLNSGYVQRGLSRYTRAWGPIYRPLSGEEQALLIRDGRVEQRFDRASIRRGVLIPPDADLVVSRGGAPLPASPGDRVTVTMAQRSSPELGDQPNVLGGGPLLMQGGRIVLNGRSEGFSPGFLSLAAPRTVVGQGNGGTWLIALRGAAGSEPTLLETALAMQQLGLRDALNLDGGSSTTVVVSGRTVMNGRGSAPRIHNGLGLLPQ
ncbi:MAG: phosphodiester glycosidase family protein [Synechococcus sp. BS307-5m-G38]|nr:phosphodiester glycosidase family protein [Synechococcus sp. BS307-5m-G38]